MEAKNHSEVNLDVAIDGFFYAQDFKAWFGKSTFDSALAEIIQREYDGIPPFSLLDVLQLVGIFYAGAVTEAFKKDTSLRPDHIGFYTYIHHARCVSDSNAWEKFFRNLLSRITVSCKRLREKNAPELRSMLPTRPCRTYESPNRAEHDPINPEPSKKPSLSSNDGTEVPSPPDTPNTLPYSYRLSHASPSPTASSSAIDVSRYTMVLKEYNDIERGNLNYRNEGLSLDPPVWRCIVNFNELSEDGTGRSKQEAKHAASERMCSLLGLPPY
ncbi:hypothetical protein BU25DRAFT_495076 [Macroventuria anomochaeta]|uniref:Uncharacterized protein n=1 Tax=Macroventuria anomochaeta TaxID=301207 RepID=A0ACB6RKA7_9PLEO|nr:uncharacterized protein BU25DRAFT_495076 [Macroventuria anomochaeta]KAF2622331.1 hypothetical protein BU25DRAFT_495076 [Macroventuria anomochaeta]